jgi:hypothetical protein
MNKPNPIPSPSVQRPGCAQQFVRTWTTLKSVLTALALVAGLLFVSSAQAQTAYFGSVPSIRLTVPVSYSGMLVMSNNFTYTTNGITPDGNGDRIITNIYVTVTGLPSGTTYNLTNASDASPANWVTFTSTALRTNSNNTLRMLTTFTFDGSQPEGTYTYSINASNSTYGVMGNLFLTIDVAHIWRGSTNVLVDGASKWSDTTNWLGGVPSSGAGANIIFNESSGQISNQWPVVGVSTNWIISSYIDNDMTIASLRFAQTNGWRYHTLQINPGKTLQITGTGGFSVLRDCIDLLAGIGNPPVVTILGTNATLIVSNTAANFNFLLDNQVSGSLLDLSRLDTFKATVSQFSVGDFETYPNYWNMDTNNFGNRFSGSGNTSTPGKFLAGVSMARTNVIHTSFVSPVGYSDPSTRQFAVGLSRTAYGSGSNTGNNQWNFGISNIIYADSMVLCGANMAPQQLGRFNPLFATNNPILIVRGKDGDSSRMTLLSIGDDGQIGYASSNVKGYFDFGTSNGRVDWLVDTMILAQDPRIIPTGQNPNIQGRLAIGAGTIDVNTVYLGYQTSGVHTNTGTFLGYCQGMLTVTNSAVVKINGDLSLGWTTETANGSRTAGAEVGLNNGQLFIQNGGTVMVSNIVVGGVTEGSQDNNIFIGSANANISTLIVSNMIADTTMKLSTLMFSNNANLTLFLDGALGTPVVYVTNLNTYGLNNSITIGGLKNITYTGGTAQIPLVTYTGGNPTLLGVSMPAGFVGSGTIVVRDTTNWDVFISTNAPNMNLVWRPVAGIGTTNWDSTRLVWSNRDNGMMTNFHSGDVVYFDDTPNLASNINQSISPLLPGNVFMTNSNVKYTITGLGLQGGGVLTKTGTGSLYVDGTAGIAFSIVQGSLTNNSGAGRFIGGVAVSAGATLVNNGTISGGINCAGTVVNAGTINGGLALPSGGVATNLSGANVNGVPGFSDGAFLYNQGTITYNPGNTCTVSSNATLINDGTISGDYLAVNGTLKDTGAGSIVLYNWLTINGPPTGGSLTNPVGGLFIPGGDGVGTTRVLGNPSSSASYAGRVQLLVGARVILKVTNDNNTLLYSGYQDFGPSASTMTYGGCALIITNVGTVPFANGQVFTMFKRIDTDYTTGGAFWYDGTSTNTYPLMSPLSPGTGLAWDLKYLYHADGDTQNGKIGIIGTATNPTNVLMMTVPMNGFVVTNYPTNVVGSGNWTTNYSTNNVIFTTLNWPTNHVGWRLQSQNNNLQIGLSNNWVTMFQTPWTNTIFVTNNLNTNSAWFYRMVYP